MRLLAKLGSILAAAGLCAVPAKAQDSGALFNTYCAICHSAGNSRAPGRDALGRMAPEQILQVLEHGSMKAQAAERSRAQRRALAEYISGKPLPTPPAIMPASAFCAGSGTQFRNSLTGPVWNGWGAGITNTRFQPADTAGMSARDVPD